MCASLSIRSLPHRSQVIRMNHDGNARNGSLQGFPCRSVAARCRSCASAVSGSAGRSFGGPAHDLAEQRVGGIASPLVLLRRHVGHVAETCASAASR